MRKLTVLIMVLVTVMSFAYVKNVILLIGDGMGINHVYLTQLLEGQPLAMTKTPCIGLITTYSANSWVTDSAAAGTALATGFKTNNRMIGLLPSGENVPTLAEVLKKYGVKIGLVVTCRITHATPASFYGHVEDRDMENELAEQLANSDFDVIFGGGYRHFFPESVKGSKRTDDKDLIALMKGQGYVYVSKKSELETVDEGKVIGLFAPSHLSPASNRPEEQPMLYEMVNKALQLLSRDGEPFFLMVEGSQIDWEAHDNDVYGVWKETVEFDKAVKVALEFAEKNPDTLVVITADHETGGLSISSGNQMIEINKLRQYKMNTETFLSRFSIDKKEEFINAARNYYGIDISDEEYRFLLGKKNSLNSSEFVKEFGRFLSGKSLVGWTTFDHTGMPVPVFSFGPGAENFTGWFDNTEIPRIIARLMGYPLTYPIYKEPVTVNN
ncbi:MAG TPA: alkaline phosphatase [Pseudothermotoga sp.]|uniref:alkaline phosphatase n=1 Tax=Pseudothermotoga lettingae TaxID=177758 RepID=UPI00074957A3|nr:alkaline phosphatase [Pseudothermotoga lettingae]KUK20052.1 MAG: Alkaline phosphatase [Pseudothermotoga lettingae]HBT26160.1 alkaline phosphatase [Pseudothermotoga sp.]